MKTDDELRRDVEDELERELSVDHGKIGVTARDGIVTLLGEVPYYSEKLDAERAVERVKGVTGIANEIRTRPFGKRTDADIAQAAVDALAWNTLVLGEDIKAEVERGRVTLRGEVDHDYQRQAAEDAVRDHLGIMGVVNEITLKPRVAPKDIKRKIEKAFERDALLARDNITVGVKGGDVTLRGEVRSWVERRAAADTAWRAPGVTSVRDLMTVSK